MVPPSLREPSTSSSSVRRPDAVASALAAAGAMAGAASGGGGATPVSAELARHGRGVGAPAGVLLQQAGDLGLDRLRHVGPQLPQWPRRLVRDHEEQRHRALARERQGSREQLVEHDAEREHVGGGAGGAARGLGRHVGGGPQRAPGQGQARRLQRARQAEVHDLDRALLVEHQVLRLDVAVHDAAPVRVGERGGDVTPDPQGLGDRERPAREALAQAPAGNQLHGDEGGTALVLQGVERGDVGVREGGGRQRLALEPSRALGVGRQPGRDELERDPTL